MIKIMQQHQTSLEPLLQTAASAKVRTKKDTMPRYIQLDEWIFEVKNIRALRVNQYGQPYDAIASVCINGDNANIDGLMTLNDDDFTQDDYATFMKFFQRLGMSEVHFDGFTEQAQQQLKNVAN